MAKQLVNPVERHVEKAVLAIGVLLLIGVVVRYLATSPNQLEVGGKWASPKTIDAQLALKAATVRDSIKRAQPQEEMPEQLFSVFEEELDPFKSQKLPLTLPTAVAIGPEVPIVDRGGPVEGQTELATVMQTDEPAVTYGRSTYRFLDEDDRERRSEANWVTISALFDVKTQMAEQRRLYGVKRKEVIFGPVELQRRACRDDGSWSDDDWESVEPWSWPPLETPRQPEINLVQDGDRIVVQSGDQERFERFFERLRDPLRQLDLLRPLLPEIANGTTWMFPSIPPVAYRGVLDMDDQYLSPNDPPSANPEDRYKKEVDEEVARVDVLTAAERIAKEFEEADRLLRSARDNCLVDEAVMAYNIGFEIARDREAGPSDKNKAARLIERAQQTESDVKRRMARGECARGRTTSKEDEEEEAKREPLPIQQIWVHDAKPGSVESGKTYQYRLRPQIYNRLAGQPGKFRNPADAATVYIPGEWSEPVEVSVEPDRLFYVTSKDQRKHQVAVEFYRWFEGIWVKARGKLSVGDVLKLQKRVDVPSWEDPTTAENTQVDFIADATVLDIDFDRDYWERKRGRTRSGIKFNPASKNCCAVFVDSKGRLQERFVATDKGHPHKRAIRVWSPPRKD